MSKYNAGTVVFGTVVLGVVVATFVVCDAVVFWVVGIVTPCVCVTVFCIRVISVVVSSSKSETETEGSSVRVTPSSVVGAVVLCSLVTGGFGELPSLS